ncbi:MAG: DUF3604 domain-containing protein [Stagnimonas sp.]|nr:DUF3604 domain-containing protein [Stagnimonas sp.]
MRSPPRRSLPALLIGLSLALAGCGDSQTPSAGASGDPLPPAPLDGHCDDYRPGYRNAYFGDLHVHTKMSLDAYFFSSINGPREAHRYAKGEPVGLPAIGSDDPYTPARQVRIDRPLDFTAITDHAEFIGGAAETCEFFGDTSRQLCDTVIGQTARGDIVNIAEGNTSPQVQLLVSIGDNTPLVDSLLLWPPIKQITDEENQPCRYTALHGYEYTPNFLTQMLHRNVIFRGDAASVPDDVYSAAPLTSALLPENGNTDWDLFDYLQRNCLDREGCAVLTIAHNSNGSAGRYFLGREANAGGYTVVGDLSGRPLGRKIPQTEVYFPMSAEDAQLRRRIEKSFEISQHKGQSDCSAGLEGPYLASDEDLDPYCGFELWKSVCTGKPGDPASCAAYCRGDPARDPPFCGYRTPKFDAVEVCASQGPDGSSRPASGGSTTGGCVHPLDYYRNAMVEGMAIRKTLGVNPYKLNLVAATDTHNGNPGEVRERGFQGKFGVIDDEPKELFGFWACDSSSEDSTDPGNCANRRFEDFSRVFNPGGITGVWASENTRGEIWDAISRGETFGTSGPRLRLRSVASWNPLPADICAQLASSRDLIAGEQLRDGARMGGDLPPPPTAGAKPHFAVWAVQDPEGHPLQAIDLIKGYLDAEGEPKVRTYLAVAGEAGAGPQPDPDSCQVQLASRPESLCAVWTDEQFDARHDAYWYARVREVASCRWSTWSCNIDHAVDCSLLDPANGLFPAASGLQGYEGCCAPIDGGPGKFHGQKSFHTSEERGWTSPIWYEAR